MAATATQDDDLIIFNDEVEEETNTSSDDSSQGDDDSTQGDDTAIDDAKINDIIQEESDKGETDLISFNLEETQDTNNQESQNSQEEKITNAGTEDIISFDTEISDETQEISKESEEISVETPELNIDLEVDSTPDDIKEELIEIQDSENLTSFENMGIDLNKLGDKEGENLEGITIESENDSESLLEIPEESSEVITEETDHEENLDMHLDSIGDFAAGIAGTDIDEGTHNGILDAAILKLETRESNIDEDIASHQAKVAEEEEKITELKSQIKGHQGEVTEEKKKIKDLNTEKDTIAKTKEGIEKMKIAA